MGEVRVELFRVVGEGGFPVWWSAVAAGGLSVVVSGDPGLTAVRGGWSGWYGGQGVVSGRVSTARVCLVV